MNIQTMVVSSLVAAPWRFSEDRNLGVSQYEQATPIFENIKLSLEQHGQLSPIHVRPLDETGKYEIVDGHIVVDVARQLGLEHLDAIMHLCTAAEARRLYIYFNLNRGGQYGQRHVKILREFQAHIKAGGNKADLYTATAFPEYRVDDYLSISEQDANWRQFMYITDKVHADQESILSGDNSPVPDN